LSKDVEFAVGEVHEGILEEEVPVDGQLPLFAVQAERFSGPLPHPDYLAKYDSILPGAAERIFQMTEKSLDHSIAMDRAQAADRTALIEAETTVAKRAQLFTFILVLVFLGTAAYALYLGQPAASVVAGLAGLGTIAWALRGGAKQTNNDDSPTVDQSSTEN
jgi:uncharacterized membrane protein